METHVRNFLFLKRKTLSHNPGPQVPLSRQETRRGDRAPFLWSKGKERLHTPHRRGRHRKDEALPRAHIDCLNNFLLERYASGANAVVIIDEAQHLNQAALEMVRLLSNLETEREKLLQIVLVGQPELREKLKKNQLRQLNQRIIIRYHLEALDLGETAAYIGNRLMVAGSTGSIEFTPDALHAIHKGSGGIPRMINIVCDRALTAAYISLKRLVDKKGTNIAIYALESEGYIASRSADILAYLEYTPHIAASMFLLALLAGIFWGPFVLVLGAGH